MWEYKIVELVESEFKDIQQKIRIVKNKVNDDFKEEYPTWEEEKKKMAKEKIDQFLDIKYYGLIKDCIKNIYPYYKGDGKTSDFNSKDYLEYKINENGYKGWELDKLRLMSYNTYTNGILIFRKKI